jgi:hypothetical protein
MLICFTLSALTSHLFLFAVLAISDDRWWKFSCLWVPTSHKWETAVKYLLMCLCIWEQVFLWSTQTINREYAECAQMACIWNKGRGTEVMDCESQSRQNKRNKEIRQIKTTCVLFAVYVPLHIVVAYIQRVIWRQNCVYFFVYFIGISYPMNE